MKNLQGSKLVAVFVALMITGLAFMGCNQNDPVSSIDGETAVAGSLEKKKKTGGDTPAPSVYPMISEIKVKFDNTINGYESGHIELLNKSKFKFDEGSVTPPPGHPAKAPLTITMRVDYDDANNELVFSFGPHGTQFSPNAEIEFNWGDLGTPSANLYYIDDNTGEYIKQKPDNQDNKKKKIYLYVPHFSRYALVHG